MMQTQRRMAGVYGEDPRSPFSCRFRAGEEASRHHTAGGTMSLLRGLCPG
jgi:hypothetical protein